MKKNILACLLFCAVSLKAQTNQKNGVALQSYDPVAYFKNAQAILGNKEITTQHNDVVYQFSSEDNKALFLKNPAQYEPQYGGYCAYGMSNGYKAPIKPEAFTIVDNKLYLNYSLEVKAMWIKEQAVRIEKADHTWEKLKKS
ncbi:YHS domain-containing (seleno)protein [Flavobacterium sp.]